ncbi:hypothetical protein C5167_036961 [Papaver somniferum]|uniref:Dirigent protein n=1 Tax=Papaver somniferum TaxID=3469 RepID=A0A4Y7I8Q5_PAPSO|nr:hypothetical protein C5167_036961 [Papaver somniferum]
MTRLHFYIHDVVTGDNPTAVRIAEAPGTKSSSTMSGALYMVDDPLTEGPNPDSRHVGRAQGFYGHSGKNEMSLIMGMSLVFTANEKFNGSSISVFTRNPITHTDREFAIVGGTRYFQFACGYISGKKYRTGFTVPHKMGKEKMTKLHFYFHDVITGKNPVAVQIAQARGTKSSPTMFGAMFMIDDPLTEGPSPRSRLVGRAQGFYGHSGKDELSLTMSMSLVFTGNKKFNGSTISVLSRNPIEHTKRELAIVGGTGYFRYARGFISGKTYRVSGPDAIVEYTSLLITPAQANHPHWGETVPYSSPPEKMTKLHFYLHDNLIGSNQTGFRIAEAAITNSSSTFFGATFMVDDPLTEGPDPESRLVGRAQGLFGE